MSQGPPAAWGALGGGNRAGVDGLVIGEQPVRLGAGAQRQRGARRGLNATLTSNQDQYVLKAANSCSASPPEGPLTWEPPTGIEPVPAHDERVLALRIGGFDHA